MGAHDAADVKEWQQMLKKHHMCTRCKRQDERTIAGRVLCAECAKKLNDKHRKWLSEGRCCRCGRNPHASDSSICDRCKQYFKRRYKIKIDRVTD